jgi:hypothetical protein
MRKFRIGLLKFLILPGLAWIWCCGVALGFRPYFQEIEDVDKPEK